VICAKKGCTNVAQWIPVLLLYPEGRDCLDPATSQLDTAICLDCRQKITLKHLITDASWAQILMEFSTQGKAAPGREKTRIKWIKIEDRIVRKPPERHR